MTSRQKTGLWRSATRSAIVGVLVVGAMGAACRQVVVTDTDQQRMRVMLADPVVTHARRVTERRPGEYWTGLKHRLRGQVHAVLYERGPGGSARVVAGVAEAVQHTMADLVRQMRAEGWQVIYVQCAPIEVASDEEPEPTPTPISPSPALVPAPDQVQWTTYLYRVIDGVSYWASLTAYVKDSSAIPHTPGEAPREDGRASIDLIVRAPNQRDEPNLFSDRPPALDASTTCIDQQKVTRRDVQAGMPLELDLHRSRNSPYSPMKR